MIGLLTVLAALQAASQPVTASGAFVDASGAEVGTVGLTQLPSGVLINARLEGVPPGAHGFHLHTTGRCEPGEGFGTAGGHLSAGMTHGLATRGGPHPGDMPNAYVGEDGVLEVSVLNTRVALEGDRGTPLLDRDGTALLIHSGADDHRSQPSGDAGERIACAVIERD